MSGLFSIVASESEWLDWRWQLGQSAASYRVVIESLGWSGLGAVHAKYPIRVTPYYMSLARSKEASDPILRQCVPNVAELREDDFGSADPFAEEGYSPVPRLVHRYEDRALFLTTSDCATHCRHCMRKRNWSCLGGRPSDEVLEQARDYVARHKEIREILISGGDPLTMDDAELARVLDAFASLPNVEILRLGSRAPVVMPQRLTEELARVLGDCRKPVWLATHFNHPWELTDLASEGILRLLKQGVPTVNQSVLLAGVNDDAETLKQLFTGLLAIRVKPYYLFHGDPIEGTTHFRTGIEKGLELMASLRGRVSGLAMPAFSFDLPEGGGKIRLEPGMEIQRDADGVPVFQSCDGRSIRYPVRRD